MDIVWFLLRIIILGRIFLLHEKVHATQEKVLSPKALANGLATIRLNSETIVQTGLTVCLGKVETGYLFESRREKCGHLLFPWRLPPV